MFRSWAFSPFLHEFQMEFFFDEQAHQVPDCNGKRQKVQQIFPVLRGKQAFLEFASPFLESQQKQQPHAKRGSKNQ